VNPDSVCVDSCIGSPTFGKQFARETFEIGFTQTIVFLPWAPQDSIIEFSWTAIDTAFPAIRSAFQQLESDFGTLWLRKANPNDTSLNSSGNTAYYLRFANRVAIDSIVSRLSSMQLIDLVHYNNRAGKLTGIFDDREVTSEATALTGNRMRIHGTESRMVITTPQYQEYGRICSVLGITLQTFSFDRTGTNEGETVVDISSLAPGVYFIVCGGRSVAFVKGGW
jgi:hypothetical protein